MPLDKIDDGKIAEWFDDRVVSFVQTLKELQEQLGNKPDWSFRQNPNHGAFAYIVMSQPMRLMSCMWEHSGSYS